MPDQPTQPAPPIGLVIALPHGFELGGVTTWAKRTRDALAARGGLCELVGPGINGTAERLGLDDFVRLFAESIERLRGCGAGPIVLAPQLSGEAYAAACVAAHHDPGDGIRVVGWMHTDIRYDTELIRRFAPALSRVFCVSLASADHLRRERACDPDCLRVIRTGVPVDAAAPVATGPAHDPIRLLYVGRLDAFQKRAGATLGVVRLLRKRGRACELTIIGDGPSRDATQREAERLGGVTMPGPVDADRIGAVYADHDLLLMPSRSEGLGLARIEAAAHGCVPLVTPGGAAEGIRGGTDGVVVECPPDAGDAETAERFADAIAGLPAAHLGPMRARCVESARAIFGMDAFAHSLVAELHALHSQEPDRGARAAIARDPAHAAAFTVPDDFETRLAAATRDLAGRRIILHGAGAHTRAIWESLHELGLRIAAVADDDPERWGATILGVPVIAPADAGDHDAGVVLISSWLHEDAIWARRQVYEDAGLHVRRIYDRVTEHASQSAA